MKFKVIVIGDKIEKFYLEAIKEYAKRLERYCKIQLKHLKNESAIDKEISDRSHCILITTNGNSISSEELAYKINEWGVTGLSDISIVINAENVSSNEQLTLSPMEMDAGLKTTIVFEQIYRSYRIINNHPYHK